MWLKNCYQSHQCEALSGPVDCEWYPKRLVCLSDPAAPRILDTGSERPYSRYATLSHCWGSNQDFITLTTKRLNDFCKSIPVNTLPKSFRDAILVCKRLSIYYIWIDSLCILQDSEPDWLLHTNEMSLIYQNCCLILSFDAAANLLEGAFRHRNTDVLQECCALSMFPGDQCWSFTVETDLSGSETSSDVSSDNESSDSALQNAASIRNSGEDSTVGTISGRIGSVKGKGPLGA